MGKVRRYRQKYHLSKVGSSKAAADVKTSSVADTKSNPIGENIFAGIDISIDSLTKSLGQEFDARSVVSTKSRKELKLEEQCLKKKVKKKLRHERFLKKLEVTHEALKAAKERGKKKQKPVNKNLTPSLSSPGVLPSWDPVFNSKFKNNDHKPRQKPKGIMKMKKRIKQQTTDTKHMKTILKDKKFRLNPGERILELLKERVASNR